MGRWDSSSGRQDSFEINAHNIFLLGNVSHSAQMQVEKLWNTYPVSFQHLIPRVTSYCADANTQEDANCVPLTARHNCRGEQCLQDNVYSKRSCGRNCPPGEGLGPPNDKLAFASIRRSNSIQ